MTDRPAAAIPEPVQVPLAPAGLQLLDGVGLNYQQARARVDAVELAGGY